MHAFEKLSVPIAIGIVEAAMIQYATRLRQAQADSSMSKANLFYFHTKQALLFYKAFQHIAGNTFANTCGCSGKNKIADIE